MPKSTLLILLSATTAMTLQAASASAQSGPTPDNLVSVCSGVSLPPSVVTDIMDPVVTGSISPIETALNTVLGTLLLPTISTNVGGLLTTAASGDPVTLKVLSANGTLVGPSDACYAAADGYTLDTQGGISLGGNNITGLGRTGQEASAGELDSIAIGNLAITDPSALRSIALGTGASVGAAGTDSLALGAGATINVGNSVALGANSTAVRGAVTGVSVGEVSVGSAGNERQVTNVADATQATDAVNLRQLQAVAAAIPTDVVQYDDATHSTVTFDGTGGTLLTNVKAGAVTATSSDAVNGAQLYAVQSQLDTLSTQVTTNTTAIANLSTQLSTNMTAVTNLSVQIANGGIGPVQYSNPGTPTVPNGGIPTNDLTLVGAAPAPVALHNVAAGVLAAGSTDAVNAGQLFTTNQAVSAAQSTANSAVSAAAAAQGTADTALVLANNSVQYSDPAHTLVSLGDGTTPVRVTNVANGTIAPGSTDAVNGGQIYGLSYTVANAVSYDMDMSGNRTNSVTLVGGSAGPVTVHNVGPAVVGTDAVNLNQMNGAMASSVSIANSYTDQRFLALDADIGSLAKDARAGTAAALAAAAMPQSMENGRFMIAGGLGHYRGRSSFAAGASYKGSDGRSAFRLGVTYDSSQSVGAQAGVGFQL